MIFAVVGANGGFPYFCSQLINDLLQASGRKSEIIEISGLHDLGTAIFNSTMDDIVFVVRRPDREFCNTLVESSNGIFIAHCHPAAVFAHWLRALSGNLLQAMREVTYDLAALCNLRTSNNDFMIGPREVSQSLQKIVKEIAGKLPVFIPDDAIDHVSTLHHAPPKDLSWIFQQEQINMIYEKVLPPYRDDLQPLLEQYRQTLERGKIEEFTLSPALFLHQGEKPEPVTGPLDMTGDARCLIFGPMINLPYGNWTLQFQLTFSEQLVNTRCGCDAFTFNQGRPIVLADAPFQVTFAGTSEVSISFYNDSPNANLEFRLFCHKAIFDGMYNLEGAKLKYVAREVNIIPNLTKPNMPE